MTVWRPLLALLAIGCLLALARGRTTPAAARSERSVSAATATTLGALGLVAQPNAIHWVDPPYAGRGWFFGEHRFLVVGRRNNEPSDIWLGTVRLSPEGRFIELSSLHNLSDTSAVSETDLTVSGERFAWSVMNGQAVVSIQLGDLKGQGLTSDGEMTALERWQTRITYLQETGQLEGISRRAFRFKSPRPMVTLALSDRGLQVESNGMHWILASDDRVPSSPDLTAEPSDIGAPGDIVTWAVDRVRGLPWFGTDRMQWVKAVAFGAWERLDTLKRSVIRSDPLAPLTDEVGDVLSKVETRAPDPATGWPPAPMAPILQPPLPTEGVFRPLDDDPFAVPPSGGPSPFAFAFIRPDETRLESRIFITLWDPRRLELHTMTGTREPKTATGETGSGTVPRTLGVVERLAGAFNGGFQATHGEFGMMAQRIVYLPPKPYAATIAERADGTLGMGTWPNDDSIPDGMIGFRQNLTPLVADDAVNPYARSWWGGVPPGWQDATRTVRTGLCLTKDDFVAYFYGSSINADHLAKGMVAARCSYGVHLDMNPGHTGFEFYRVGTAASLPKIPRKLEASWETRGEVHGAPGWEFLGRRMLKTMHLMHFPRYVRTDSRDFFYLTHRHILPPPSASQARRPTSAAERYVWHTKDHDQQGFPPAIASAKIRPEPARPELEVTVVVLDSKWLVPCVANCPDLPAIARMNRANGNTGLGLYYDMRQFVITDARPSAKAIPIAFGRDQTHAGKSVAAIGVAHGDWLYYVEATRGADRQRDAGALSSLLAELGCNAQLFLDQSLGLSFDAGATSHREGLLWFRETAPMAARMFKDTAVVSPAIWQPLQSKRVRYVRATSAPPAERPRNGDDAAQDAPDSAPPAPAAATPPPGGLLSTP